MFCTNCGAQLPDGVKFCTQCGTRLAEIPVAAAMQQAVEEVIPEAPAPEDIPVVENIPAVEDIPVPETVPEIPAEEPSLPEPPVTPEEVIPEESSLPEEPIEEFILAEPEIAPEPFQAESFAAPEEPQISSWQDTTDTFQEAPAAAGQFQPVQGFSPYQQEAAQPQGFQGQGFPNQSYGQQPYGAYQNQGFQNQGYQPQSGAPQGFQGQGFQPQNYPGYNPQAAAPVQTAEKPKKKSKAGLIIGIILGVIVLGVLVFFLVRHLNQPKDPDPVAINLDDYVTVTFEGYNGTGHVLAEEFDIEKLFDDYADQIEWTNAAKKNYSEFIEEYDSAADFVLDPIWGYLSNDGNLYSLRNGDKVEWVWIGIDDDFITTLTNAEITYSNLKFTVSGLDEAATFDPFQDVTVTFSGTSGSGWATVENTSEAPYFTDGTLYIWIHENWDLKNGDEILLYIDDMDEELLEKYGVVPSRHEMTVTVEGLPYYITDYAEIPQDIIHDMSTYFAQEWLGYLTNDVGIDEITNPRVTYVGSYYTTIKQDAYNIDTNRLYNVYNITLNVAGTDMTYYYYALFTDFYVDSDGSVSFYEESYDSYAYTDNSFVYTYKKDDKDESLTIAGYQTLADLDAAVTADNADFDIVHRAN